MLPNDSVVLKDRYLLEKRLGKGGMATVYRARDLSLERTVAVKVLRSDYASDAGFRERFRQEAKAAANLAHRNIVTIHDYVVDADHFFIVMEYVPGKDLNTLIYQKSSFSINAGIDLAVQACAGLGYAHRAGLVHCDVKPHNFIVTPEKKLKVTDFGIARALASISPDEESDIIWGSPQYFSPEQAAGMPPSPASDVYSLGVVMYYLFTGKLPFRATSANELARMHQQDAPIPPRELNPQIPKTLEQIILKVLSKEPSARYRTADQLGRVLLNLRQLSEPSAPPQSNDAVIMRRMKHADEENAYVDDALEVDYVAIFLSLVAFVLWGGLIPFGMWLYFIYNPPGQ